MIKLIAEIFNNDKILLQITGGYMSRTTRNKNNLPRWITNEVRFIDNVIKGYSTGERYKWSPYSPYDADHELMAINGLIDCYIRDGNFQLSQRNSNKYFSGNPWDESDDQKNKSLRRRMWAKSNRHCAKDEIADCLNDMNTKDDWFKSLKKSFNGFDNDGFYDDSVEYHHDKNGSRIYHLFNLAA